MLTQQELEQVVAALKPWLQPSLPPPLLGQQLATNWNENPNDLQAGDLIVPANPNRVLLWFSNSSSNSLYVYPGLPGATGTFGFEIGAQAERPILTTHQHGTIPQLAWYAGTFLGGGLAYLEILWKP